MNADEKVMEHSSNTLSENELMAMFERLNTRLDETVKSFWAVEFKENNDYIGFIGLSEPNFEAEFIPCTEIGWRLRSKYWGIALKKQKLVCKWVGVNMDWMR